MESFQKPVKSRSIAVVIPAHNEEITIESCIESITGDHLGIEIFVSNNCSSDSTKQLIEAMSNSISSRHVDTLLSPVRHFVSSGRWALQNSNAEYFCFLAADDLFSPEYVSTSITQLGAKTKYDMTFPSVEWFLGVDPQHRIKAPKLGFKFGVMRQVKAFLLPNTSEIANQVYGVFQRKAFECLIEKFEKNGDRFASDYFAVIDTLGVHRSLAIRNTFVFRRVRHGEDLLKRVSFQRKNGSNVLLILWDYLALHIVINNAIARTWSESKDLPIIFCGITTQLLRFLQLFIEIPIHISRRIK